MANEIAKLFVTLGLDDKEFLSKVNKAQKNMAQVGKVMTGLGAGITASLGIATKMAADFDTAMREVNTMMQLSDDAFNEFSNQVQQMSTEMGVDAVKSAEALYQAISAGVPKENAIDFLRVATKAAIGGVTDTETAVDGLTTVINAFGLDISEAQRVADIMFTTVKGGKTTMEELSASLFNVAPVASAFGVNIEQVAAALATMTQQGVPTTVATTQLRAAILSLSAPTTEQKKAMEELGLEMSAEHLETVGLAGAMQEILDATKGDASALRKLVGSVEGVQAILALTGENAEAFSTQLDNMVNSAGALEAAFEQMAKSSERILEAIQQILKGMAIAIGNNLLPVLKQVVDGIKPIISQVVDWMQRNPELTRTIVLIVAAIGVLMAVLGPILIMLPMLAAGFTMLLGPVGWVIASIMILAGLAGLVIANWETIKEKTIEIWEGIKLFFIGLWAETTDIFRENWDKILAILFPAIGLPILIARNWEAIVDSVKNIFDRVRQTVANAINWVINQINRIPGIDIPVVTTGGTIALEQFAQGGLITEPTLLYGLNSQKPYAIAGERGPEVVSPAGAGITNNFNISQLVVREESDVQRVAKELFRLQQMKARQQGVT